MISCWLSIAGHLASDAVHRIENIFSLNADGQALLLAGLAQNVGHLADGGGTGGGIHQHDHGEVLLKDGLGDVQNVDVVGGQQEQTIRWTMCTPAEAVVGDKNTFILTADGKRMEVKVDAPVEVNLHVWDNVSPNYFDYANTGTCRIVFDYKVPAGESVKVKVTLKEVK